MTTASSLLSKVEEVFSDKKCVHEYIYMFYFYVEYMMNDYDGGLQAHIVVNFYQDLVYVHCKVGFSYHEYSLCPKECSLCL